MVYSQIPNHTLFKLSLSVAQLFHEFSLKDCLGIANTYNHPYTETNLSSHTSQSSRTKNVDNIATWSKSSA